MTKQFVPGAVQAPIVGSIGVVVHLGRDGSVIRVTYAGWHMNDRNAIKAAAKIAEKLQVDYDERVSRVRKSLRELGYRDRKEDL